MPGPIATAFVEVLADLSKLGPDAQRRARDAFKAVAEEADKSSKAAERSIELAEKEIEKNLRAMELEAAKAANQIAKEFRASQRQMERDAQRTERETAKLAERQAREAQRAQEKIERDAQKAAEAQIRAAQRAEREAAAAYARLAKEHEREQQKIARDAEREALRVQKAHEKASRDAEKEFARLAKEAQKQEIKLNIQIKKDNKQLLKTEQDITSFLRTTLVRSLAGVGIAAGVALTAGLVPTAVNLVAALAPAIAALAGALPGAVAVAGAAIGTLVLGFQGLGDAIKNIGDAEKFAEALEKLAPNAQAFAIALRDVLPQLKGIQQAVQNNLFAGFDTQLKGIVANLSGPLKTGLSEIATEFNRLGQEAGKFFQSQAAVDALNAILGSTRDILREFGPAIQPLLNGFSALAVAAQPFISALSGGLADVAKRFGEFLTEAGKSGALNDFFSAALRTLGDLGLILKDVGSILGSIFSSGSAGGESLLSRFRELTKTVAEFLSSAEGKEALTTLFSTLSVASKAVSDVLRPLLPVLGQIVTLFGAELTGALQALSAILVPVAKALADGLKPVLPQLAQAAKDLTPSLIVLGNALGKELAEAIKEMLPSLTQLILTFAQDLVPVLIKIIPIAIKLLPIFFDMSVAAIALANALLKVAEINIGALFAGLSAILDIDWSGIGKSISDAFSTAWNAVKKFFSDIASSVGEFFSGIGKWFSDGFKKASDETSSFFSKIGTFFTELPGKIGTWLSSLPGKLVDAINAAFDAAVQAIGRAIGLVLFAVLVLPGKIKEGLISLGETIRVAVVNAWDTAKQWTETKIGELVAFVSGLPEKATNAISSLKEKLTTFITDTWNSFTTFTVTKWDEIIAFLSGLPQKALDAIFALKEKVTSFINDTITSAKNGVVNGFNSIVDFVKSVPDKLNSLGQFFVNAGKNLIDGFIRGFKNVGNFIGDVAGSIVREIKGFINRIIQNLNSGIADIDAKLPGDLPRIPELAAGGIVSGATTAIVGEAGPEAVIPLSGNRGRKALAAIGGEGGGQSVVFESGAIAISFEGVIPTKTEATQTGEAVGAGILSALMRRDVRFEMRLAS